MTDNLPVVETFHSLQGEGLHAGRSAFFIRLGGCSVGCSWCDTKHSWPEANHPQLAVIELARQGQAHHAATQDGNIVCVAARWRVCGAGDCGGGGVAALRGA